LNKIKEEVQSTGILNKAYIPILQNVSPGEIQNAQNALDFAKALVTGWLSTYKFKNWQTHSTTGKAVTEADKKERAAEIADQLCDHGQWKTHGRSINIEALRKMKLKITDYTQDKELSNAIERYFTLLKMTFDGTNHFKIYETPTSQIYRFIPIQGIIQQNIPMQDINSAEIKIPCSKCKNELNVQAKFNKGVPLKPGFIEMPREDKIQCPACQAPIDLVNLKKNLEAQIKKKIVYSSEGAEYEEAKL